MCSYLTTSFTCVSPNQVDSYKAEICPISWCVTLVHITMLYKRYTFYMYMSKFPSMYVTSCILIIEVTKVEGTDTVEWFFLKHLKNCYFDSNCRFSKRKIYIYKYYIYIHICIYIYNTHTTYQASVCAELWYSCCGLCWVFTHSVKMNQNYYDNSHRLYI